MDLGISPLKMKSLLESNPLRSSFSVRGLTARGGMRGNLGVDGGLRLHTVLGGATQVQVATRWGSSGASRDPAGRPVIPRTFSFGSCSLLSLCLSESPCSFLQTHAAVYHMIMILGMCPPAIVTQNPSSLVRYTFPGISIRKMGAVTRGLATVLFFFARTVSRRNKQNSHTSSALPITRFLGCRFGEFPCLLGTVNGGLGRQARVARLSVPPRAAPEHLIGRCI